MENLPKTTGGLIVYPHLLNIHDMFYLMGAYNYESGKIMGGVIHRVIPELYPGYCRVFFRYLDTVCTLPSYSLGSHEVG